MSPSPQTPDSLPLEGGVTPPSPPDLVKLPVSLGNHNHSNNSSALLLLPRPIFNHQSSNHGDHHHHQLPPVSTPPPPPHPPLPTPSPYHWSPARKRSIKWLCCLAAVFASYAASSYAPCKEQLLAEWRGEDVGEEAVLVGITIFTAGFGLGPMFLAPLSELRGRRPIFMATGLLLVICQIGCAVSRTFPGMLVARFFAGVGSSTYSTLVGGVITDVYRPWERNAPMAVFSGGALAGIGLGPLVCGFIAEYSSWQWVFWHQVIANAALVLCFACFVPETRESILLRRECDRLNRWVMDLEEHGHVVHYDISHIDGHEGRVVTTRRVRWTLGDAGEGEGQTEQKTNVAGLIVTSLTRPFVMLYQEPIVTYLSLWATFSWSVLYIALAAVPLVFSDVYGFSLSEADAVFAAACIGPMLATILSIVQEGWLGRRCPMGEKTSQPPEIRLYFTCFEGFLLPVGLFMFGWTANPSVHWIAPTISIVIATAGIFSIYLSVFNYLGDCYRIFSSSALAAQSACRNIVGGILPLVTTQMYTGLGYGPGSSMLGGIAVVLCMGSWFLTLYGEPLRRRSRFAQALADLE